MNFNPKTFTKPIKKHGKTASLVSAIALLFAQAICDRLGVGGSGNRAIWAELKLDEARINALEETNMVNAAVENQEKKGHR